MRHQGVWRDPDEETLKLYPGLVVHDGRYSGGITVGRTRLPLSALAGQLCATGWDDVRGEYEPQNWTGADMDGFLWALLDHRGEFARLILILADVERREHDTNRDAAWWQVKTPRRRVIRQLRACLAALETLEES